MAGVLGPHPGHERPEQAAPEQHEGRGQGEQRVGEGDRDAQGAGIPEGLGERVVGQAEAQEGEDDRPPAGEDRRGGGAQGRTHRVVPVLGATELLAVAGDEQQGVVGPRPEDEHRRDAGDGAVGPDVGDAAEDGERLARDLVACSHDRQGHQPQPRTAIGEQQQDGDDPGRRAEQADVGAVEHRTDVCAEGGTAGDGRADPLGEVGAHGCPQRRDGLGEVVVGEVRAKRHHHQGGRPVLRELGRDGGRTAGRGRARRGRAGRPARAISCGPGRRVLRRPVGDGRDAPVPRGGDGCDGCVVEAARRARVDDDGRGDTAGREAGAQVLHLGRFGARGQHGRGRRDGGRLAGEREGCGGHEDRQHHDDPLHPGPHQRPECPSHRTEEAVGVAGGVSPLEHFHDGKNRLFP